MYQKKDLILTESEKRRLPIIIENEEWNMIFGERDEESLQELKIKLQKLIDEDESAKDTLRSLNKEKKKTMAKILSLSDEVNNKNQRGSLKELDKHKRLLERLNVDIEEAKYLKEQLPKEISDANFSLLLETVEIGYEELTALEEDNKNINQEMIEIRDRLKELFDERNLNDAKIDVIYTMLHDSLGAKLIEKVDTRMERDEEDDRD